MPEGRDELRNELLAMLAAGQELPDETHQHLVDAFLEGHDLAAAHPFRTLMRSAWTATHAAGAPAMAALAVLQGLLLYLFGQEMLSGVLGMPPYAGGYMRVWLLLGVLWVMEIVVTVLTVAAITRRSPPEHQPRAQRLKRALRPR
jgi:hypothetical protein